MTVPRNPAMWDMAMQAMNPTIRTLQNLNGLLIRRVLERESGVKWLPPNPYGLDGWWLVQRDGPMSVFASVAPHDESGTAWVHASISGTSMPTYEHLTWLHKAVFGERWAYQVFAPTAAHVNLHVHALHLWGRLDGKPVLPEFQKLLGSI